MEDAPGPPRKKRVTFSEDEYVEVKDRQETGLKRAGENITSLHGALTHVGEDEDEHVDADIPVSVVEPTHVRGDKSFGHAIAQKNGLVCQWVVQGRGGKELIKEEATSSECSQRNLQQQALWKPTG